MMLRAVCLSILVSTILLSYPHQGFSKIEGDVIGIVDMKVILNEYEEARATREEITNLENDLKEKADVYEKKIAAMREENRSEEDIRSQYEVYGGEIDRQRRDALKRSNELTNKLREEISEAIAEVAKSKGVTIVFDKQFTLYADSFDITTLVITELNNS